MNFYNVFYIIKNKGAATAPLSLHISYELFRKIIKKFCGVSAGEFQLDSFINNLKLYIWIHH